MSYSFLSSPYTHPEGPIRQHRYERACDALLWSKEKGMTLYSPVVLWHPMSLSRGLPPDSPYYAVHTRAMLRTSSVVYVLAIEGWDVSPGIASERKSAQSFDIPVAFIVPLHSPSEFDI